MYRRKLAEKMEGQRRPASDRAKVPVPLVGETSPVTRQRLERIAERIEIPSATSMASKPCCPCSMRVTRPMQRCSPALRPHGRALYLYLEQGIPGEASSG